MGHLRGPDPRGRLRRQLQPELSQEHLLGLVGLRDSGHVEPAPIRGRHAPIEHLEGLELAEHRPGRQAGGVRSEPLGERHVQAVREKRQEDVGLDAGLLLVVEGPEGQVPFQRSERLLHVDQLHVEAPELCRVRARQICPEEIAALPAPHGAEPVRPEGEPPGYGVRRQVDVHQPPGRGGLLLRRPQLQQERIPGERHLLQLVEPLPEGLELPLPHGALFLHPVVALRQDVHLAVLREQLDVHPGSRLLPGERGP